MMSNEGLVINAVIEEEEIATEAQVDVLKGDKGDKGEKGDTGAQGPQGEAGYTPVKGVDYYTEEEKQEIETDIQNAIEADIDVLETDISTINAEQITQNTNIQNNSEEIEEIKSIIAKKRNLITNYTEIADAQLNNVGWYETATGYSTNRKGIPVEGGKIYSFCVNGFPAQMRFVSFKTADDLPYGVQNTFIKRVLASVYVIAPANAKYMFFTSSSSDFKNVTCYEGYSADNIISDSIWTKDKVLMTLGDSLSEAGIWQTAIAGKLGFSKIKNLAVGGTKVNVFADNVTAENIEDVDVITIMGFFNSTSSVAGTITDEASHEPNASICANYKYIIDKLFTLKPTVKIILITPHCPKAQNGSEKANAVKQIANYYHLPCIDLYNKAGFNTYTFDNYLKDAVHSSYGPDGGYAQEANAIYSQILAWSGADVSTIEKIRVDGEVLTPDKNKEVDIVGKENISNKVTSISSASTDTEYPSAKCVYESQAEQDTNIQNNTDNITALLEKINYIEDLIPTGEESGEIIDISNSARYPFKKFNVGGNTKQATSPLPKEYQQVEYIQGDGKQYIDTGFRINELKNKIEFEFEITTEALYQGVIGVRPTTGYSEFSYNIFYNTPGFVKALRLDLLRGISSDSYGTSTLLKNQKYKVTNKNTRFTINNDVLNSTMNKTDGTLNYSLYLFNFNNVGTPYKYQDAVSGLKGKMYYFKAYDDNDNLLVYMIPCYRKADNVIGMYDIIRNAFYTNLGEGSFTKGNDVTLEPTPECPLQIYNVSGNINIKVTNGLNSTDSEYEEQIITLTLPEGMEMRKTGIYKDKFIPQNNKWYKYSKNRQIILNGTEPNWSNDHGENLFEIQGLLSQYPFVVGYGLSDYYKYNSIQSGLNNGLAHGEFALQLTGAGVYNIFFKDTRFNNVADFTNWLSTHNIKVQYPLVTANLGEITDATLISDLNNLKNLYSYKGATHISSDSDPSLIFEAVYRKELESIANS